MRESPAQSERLDALTFCFDSDRYKQGVYDPTGARWPWNSEDRIVIDPMITRGLDYYTGERYMKPYYRSEEIEAFAPVVATTISLPLRSKAAGRGMSIG